MRALVAGVLLAVIFSGCAANLAWWTPTPDPSLRVVVRERGKRACVSVGPKQDGCFDAVAMGSLALSRDGRHVAYPAKIQGRWAVVRDGNVGPAWDGVASPVFSEDGRHLAYAALDGTRWRAVIDDQPGALHDSLVAGTFTFAASGTRTAYAFWDDGRAHVMIDGKPGDGFEVIGPIRFSPDGSRFAYVAQTGGRAEIVVDGVVRARHDAISELAFRRDGGLSYAARDGAGWFVIEENKAAGPFETAGPYESIRSLYYPPMTESPSYIARSTGGEFVVSNGIPGPEYETVEAPLFSRDGARWGYLAREDSESVVVLNGAVRAKEASIRSLALSPDGSRFAYIVERGGTGYVVDERGDHRFDLLIEGSLVFVRDGRAWACLAGDRGSRRLYVAVEGTSRRRAFDWDEAARRVRRSAETGLSTEEARSWICDQAERILAEEASLTRRR
jgi:hypothetical protein